MKKKIKVLLVSHVGYPWGGVSQRYSDLLKSSFSQKIDLTFFESSPNKSSFSSTGSVNFQNVFGFIDVCIKYILSLFRIKPTIIHIASAHGFSYVKNSFLIIIGKLWGSKIILAPHCSISVFVPKSKFYYRWMLFTLNMCDGLIVLSSEWLKIRDITEKPNVILLKNSINLTQYIMLNRSINGSNEKVQIIYLGHIGIDKGIVDLIHAVKFLSSKGVAGYVVSIYGEESRPGELESLIALIRSLSIEDYILLCEPVFNEKKINILQDADIFIFPSHHEGLPISLIEAMAAGLPVIATCVGGIPDLIDNNRNGILVNSQSPDELAEAMKSLIENKQLRHVFGAQGRRKALENHDVENYVNHLINYYQEIIR